MKEIEEEWARDNTLYIYSIHTYLCGFMRRCIVEESVKKSVANVFVPTYFAERVGVSVTCYGYVYNIHTFTPFISYITCTHGFVLKKNPLMIYMLQLWTLHFAFFRFRCVARVLICVAHIPQSTHYYIVFIHVSTCSQVLKLLLDFSFFFICVCV